MNQSPLSRLSDQYLTALRSHFEQGPLAGLQEAHELGGQVVALGLETLDLAKIHEEVLAALILPDCAPVTRTDMIARAAVFFTEAIVPIEETHRAALESAADLKQLTATFGQRTLALADSNRELQAGVKGRKTAEAALETSERASGQLLKDSRLLERELQDMTRKILSANEAERKKMSHQLQDDIAQTLLGLHVRLLALKNEASNRHAGLAQEITLTQRLVEAAVKTINRFAREFDIPHAT
ncbi:MAG: hypothetical protein ACKVY0_28420 [Prosthecobacter sp.]|uniref:hypothetical protein n=1 Tax=Prosthecobacter sp. TaxID=1965333 RepID=UPI0038FEC0F6